MYATAKEPLNGCNAREVLRVSEPEIAHEIAGIIRDNNHFLIIGHLRPDGDCLGSCLGLREILKTMGKTADFYTYGPLPDYFKYLAGFHEITTEYPAGPYDATLCVDTAELTRVSDNFAAPAGIVANIDHHISNTNYGTHNWVDGQATAAAEMIFRLAALLDIQLNPGIATALYTGLMTDTGGFRFSNTNDTTFRIASRLVECGANPAAIAEAVWDSRKPSAVRMTGEIFSSLKYEFDGRLVWNEITQQRMREVGCTDAEPEGLSSDMRAIAGVEASILFYETTDGFCRIGFRSRGQVNVSQLAGMMGGGGHKNASGAFIREPFPQARDRALGIIRQFLMEHWQGRVS